MSTLASLNTQQDLGDLPSAFRVGLHVTAAAFVPRILEEGLRPSIGPLSQAIETVPAVYLFPSWEAMEDANWLFENWPHESPPALLAVRVDGLPLCVADVSRFEAVCYGPVDPSRIDVLFESEDGWTPDRFVQLGGKLQAGDSPSERPPAALSL